MTPGDLANEGTSIVKEQQAEVEPVQVGTARDQHEHHKVSNELRHVNLVSFARGFICCESIAEILDIS